MSSGISNIIPAEIESPAGGTLLDGSIKPL